MDELLETDLFDFDNNLVLFFKKQGLTDEQIKELAKSGKYKMLKSIINIRKTDLDCTEERYTKQVEPMTVDEYLDELHRIQIDMTEARYYLYGMIRKEEIEKEKKKNESMQKMISKIKKFFSPKKNN